MGKQHVYAKEIEEIVDNMTLMDDDLMSRVFDQNIPATEVQYRGERVFMQVCWILVC